MRFESKGIEHELKWLKYAPSPVIISHRMKNILKMVVGQLWLEFILWK
jgi:hypothetical protein